MNKKNYLPYFFLSLFLLFTHPILAETPKYITLEKKQTLKDAECKVLLKYPDLTGLNKGKGKDIQKSLEGKILKLLDYAEKMPSGIALVPELFYTAFKNGAKEMEDGGFAPMPWELNLDAQYLEGANGILMVSILVFSYTGGAHPNTTMDFWNYDMAAGKEIGITDFLKKDSIEELKKIGEVYFRINTGMHEEDNYTSAGYFWDAGDFQLPENFGFGKEGLIFYYNTYEIAAYVVGPTEFTVPWQELSSLIDRKW